MSWFGFPSPLVNGNKSAYVIIDGWWWWHNVLINCLYEYYAFINYLSSKFHVYWLVWIVWMFHTAHLWKKPIIQLFPPIWTTLYQEIAICFFFLLHSDTVLWPRTFGNVVCSVLTRIFLGPLTNKKKNIISFIIIRVI